MMKNALAIALALGFMQGCHAENAICNLKMPTRNIDGSIEVSFFPKAEWDFNDIRRYEDMYIRQGEVYYLPFGKDTIENKGPIRLAPGEILRLFRPHEGCLIEAVAEQGRVGLFVRWGMYLPGPSSQGQVAEKFLSVTVLQ